MLKFLPNRRPIDEQIWCGRAHSLRLKPKGYNSRRKEVSSPNPNLVERFLYDAYGKRSVLNATWVATVDTYSFLHGFAGGKQDAVTGRVHFRNRDYDPNLMRWISRDPIGFQGSQWNLYEYVRSKALNAVDPSGLDLIFIGPDGEHMPGQPESIEDCWAEFGRCMDSEDGYFEICWLQFEVCENGLEDCRQPEPITVPNPGRQPNPRSSPDRTAPPDPVGGYPPPTSPIIPFPFFPPIRIPMPRVPIFLPPSYWPDLDPTRA